MQILTLIATLLVFGSPLWTYPARNTSSAQPREQATLSVNPPSTDPIGSGRLGDNPRVR